MTIISRKFVPASRAPFFSGREMFLQTLRSTLLQNQIALIHGPAGVGKTAVALEYASRFAREYRWIFWINATTESTYLADLAELARQISLPIENKQSFSHIWRAWQDWMAQQKDVLLILDNLTSLGNVQDQPARPPTNSHVLLLARIPDALPATPRLSLGSLDEPDGALLLLRRAGFLSSGASLKQEDRLYTGALELAGELHGSPLALTLAGRYLKASGASPQDYLHISRNSSIPLFQSGTDEEGDWQVPEQQAAAISCTLILAFLQQAHPAAFEVLRTCSLLASDAIPLALFMPGTDASTGIPEQPEMDASIRLLTAYGLCLVREDIAALSFHPLVQAIVRRSMTPDEQQQRIEQTLQALHRLVPSVEKDPLENRLRLAGHIQRLAELSEEQSRSLDSGEAAEVFGWAGSLFWAQRLIVEAEPLLKRALTIWEKTLGLSHPQVAMLLFNLATLNCSLKHYTSAEFFAQRAVLSKAHALGADHPEVLLALENLGRIYALQDKEREARLSYEKALAIGERAGLENHPHYLATLYDLAMLDIDHDLFEEAEPLLLRLCAAWDLSPKQEGKQDLLALEAWLKLAEASVRLEKWEQAEECYERALPLGLAWFGEEHPETLKNMEQAAHALLRQGKLDYAEMAFQRIRAARTRTLGDQHPTVAAALNGLAQVALEKEDLDEALSLLEQARSIYEQREEPEDLALAEVLENLAMIGAAQEQYEQAIAFSQRALAIRQNILGKEHLDLVENLNSLATLYRMIEKPNLAEPLLLQALYIYQNAQKPEDLALDPVLNNLALNAVGRAHYWQAKMYLERSRAIRSLAFGDEHPEVAEVWYRLALIAVIEEAWAEAETLFRRALAVYQNALGEEHAQTLGCLAQVATVLTRQEKFAEAQEMFEQILHAREREPGESHFHLPGTLFALGQVALSQKRFEEAEAYLQRIMDISEQNPDVPPLVALLLLNSLTAALNEQGEHERAASLEQRSHVLNELVLRSNQFYEEEEEFQVYEEEEEN